MHMVAHADFNVPQDRRQPVSVRLFAFILGSTHPQRCQLLNSHSMQDLFLKYSHFICLPSQRPDINILGERTFYVLCHQTHTASAKDSPWGLFYFQEIGENKLSRFPLSPIFSSPFSHCLFRQQNKSHSEPYPSSAEQRAGHYPGPLWS